MAQEQWYMAIGGHQVGPVLQEDVVTNLRNGTIDGNTLVFSAGMANWTPLKDVPVLAAFLTTTASRATAAAAAPPPITGKRAHEIDFKILGSEMQFVEVELDPGESAVAEAGSMMYMTPGIQMETVFGDGSQQRSGVMGALLGAGKRLITGESLFMTVFTNQGSGKQQVSFAAPYPGKILAMDLKQLGGQLICQKDSFLCAARGVQGAGLWLSDPRGGCGTDRRRAGSQLRHHRRQHRARRSRVGSADRASGPRRHVHGRGAEGRAHDSRGEVLRRGDDDVNRRARNPDDDRRPVAEVRRWFQLRQVHPSGVTVCRDRRRGHRVDEGREVHWRESRDWRPGAGGSATDGG